MNYHGCHPTLSLQSHYKTKINLLQIKTLIYDPTLYNLYISLCYILFMMALYLRDSKVYNRNYYHKYLLIMRAFGHLDAGQLSYTLRFGGDDPSVDLETLDLIVEVWAGGFRVTT